MIRIPVVLSLCLLIWNSHSVKAQQRDDPGEEMSPGKMRRMMPAAQYIFSFSPVHVTEENVGLGISLEFFAGKKGMFSAVLPVSIAFPQNEMGNEGYTNIYYNMYAYYPLSTVYDRSKTSFYFYPGIKLYPTGAFKKVSYSLGANLLAGFGNSERITSSYTADSNINTGYVTLVKTGETRTDVSRLKLGVLFSNALNIRPWEHLYMGVEVGVGYSYINRVADRNAGTDAIAQIGLKFGYVH